MDLYNSVRDELCHNGVWKISDDLERILNRQINRFPKRETNDEETRYPEDKASMGAFLDKFFPRHYFQVQNSIIEYMTSDEFVDLIKTGTLNILDIGSGPAVASLAITDILVGVLKTLELNKMVSINYILNDPINICLGVGKDLLNSYFLTLKKGKTGICNNIILAIAQKFPSNVKQLARINKNYGEYSIVNFSYVATPLREQETLNEIRNGFSQIESMSSPKGKILILQDKYKESLIKSITKEIGESYKEKHLNQYVYSSDNSNEVQSYTYFGCLYSPQNKSQHRAIAI